MQLLKPEIEVAFRTANMKNGNIAQQRVGDSCFCGPEGKHWWQHTAGMIVWWVSYVPQFTLSTQVRGIRYKFLSVRVEGGEKLTTYITWHLTPKFQKPGWYGASKLNEKHINSYPCFCFSCISTHWPHNISTVWRSISDVSEPGYPRSCHLELIHI